MVFRKATTIDTVAAALQALLLAASLALGAPSIATAQAYPAKPIKNLVGFAPGGAMDIVARRVGQKVSASPAGGHRREQARGRQQHRHSRPDRQRAG